MKIQARVLSCDEFLYACTVEICRQSTKSVFNRLIHFFIVTNALAAQKLLQACEQVKITWSLFVLMCRSILFFKPSVMKDGRPDRSSS
jgi:hypothetical protein